MVRLRGGGAACLRVLRGAMFGATRDVVAGRIFEGLLKGDSRFAVKAPGPRANVAQASDETLVVFLPLNDGPVAIEHEPAAHGAGRIMADP